MKIGDLSAAEVERVSTEVTDAAIDRTLDILRKQRRTFPAPGADSAAEGDRVTIDFEGKIDGEPFEGGKARPSSSSSAKARCWSSSTGRARHEGRRERPSRCSSRPTTTARTWPARTDFLVTLKKVEAQHLPEVNEALPQVARHQGRHRRGAARRRQEEPGARGQVPRWRATRRAR